ncbi:MAG: hypothetical protein ACRD41_05825 [Candidatus Acidiferrales bacterium]
MSIIATLLGWSKLPQWALELAVIGVLVAGFAYYHHRVYETGITAQQQADTKASAKVEAQAKAQTIAAQNAANAAEEAYRAEINRLAAAQQPIQPVFLCDNAHAGNSGVPGAGAAEPRNARSSAGAGSVPRVSDRDSGLRPRAGNDISGLLGAWAQKADALSATIREFQSRQVTP